MKNSRAAVIVFVGQRSSEGGEGGSVTKGINEVYEVEFDVGRIIG